MNQESKKTLDARIANTRKKKLEEINLIIPLIEEGVTFKMACEINNIKYNTLRVYLHTNRDLYNKIKLARNRPLLKGRKNLIRLMDSDDERVRLEATKFTLSNLDKEFINKVAYINMDSEDEIYDNNQKKKVIEAEWQSIIGDDIALDEPKRDNKEPKDE